jgi:hypothetical protein
VRKRRNPFSGTAAVNASDYRKRAEECVRVAQNAKSHHRAFLLDIATKWLELSAHDEWTRVLLSTNQADKPPKRPGPKGRVTRSHRRIQGLAK